MEQVIDTLFDDLNNNCLDWALRYHRSTRGKRMSFARAPYLLSIYQHDFTQHPILGIKSSVQSGKSEFMIVRTFHWAHMGLTVMYTLPDDKLQNRFVRNRIDTLFNKVPFYQHLLNNATGTAKNVGLKHFSRGVLNFVHSGNEKSFLEIPADAIVADEYDKFNMANYEKAPDRLSSSDYKFQLISANPTINSFGIDEKFQNSTQNLWYIKCPHCGKYINLNWFDHFVFEEDSNLFLPRDFDWNEDLSRDMMPVCDKCNKLFDRHSYGNWVSMFPKRKEVGYQISKLFTYNNSMAELYNKFVKAIGNPTRMQVFHNSDLGECYEPEGAKLTETLLKSREREYHFQLSSMHPCIMGVDVGNVLNVIIGEPLPFDMVKVIYIAEVKQDNNFSELDKLMKAFNVRTCVIDARPESRMAKMFSDRNPGKVYLAEYIYSLRDPQIAYRDDFQFVQVDRTTIMDDIQQDFLIQDGWILPIGATECCSGAFKKQMCIPTRIYEEGKNGEGKYIYVGSPDHFYHACVYAKLARRQMGGTLVHTVDLGTPQKTIDNKNIRPKVVLPPGSHPSLLAAYGKYFNKE